MTESMRQRPQSSKKTKRKPMQGRPFSAGPKGHRNNYAQAADTYGHQGVAYGVDQPEIMRHPHVMHVDNNQEM